MSTIAKPEHSVVIYSYSPVFYWWPLWLVGFTFGLVTYFSGDSVTWTQPDNVQQTAPVKSIESDQQTHSGDGKQVAISNSKVPGFVFAVVLCFVFFHSNIIWRGYRAYFFLASGVCVLLAMMLIHTLFPNWDLWGWVKEIVYYAPEIYISADAYLFISSFLLLVWLFVILIYNRWCYMRFESGQVRIVEEVGEGENVYDTTNMTFEKEKEDLFRHYILGLGFLRTFSRFVPPSLGRKLEAVTGTGDLIVRIGGEADKTIVWPNVLSIDSKLEEITTLIKSRRVVAG